MPKRTCKVRVRGDHFTWLLGTRDGVWQADGRSNTPDVGRHSLNEKDKHEAMRLLKDLDTAMAVKHGLVARPAPRPETGNSLPLADGWQKYIDHCRRPPLTGGVTEGTAKRYRPVFDKFVRYAEENGISSWRQVTNGLAESYGRWLYENDYAGRTQALELTTLKQAVKHLVREGLLPPAAMLTFKVTKIHGSDTYCYSQEEVKAIIAHCRGRAALGWLGDVVTALALTGLRIGELAGLRWNNVDLDRRRLRLGDASRRARKSERQSAPTTKSHRDRALPLKDELVAVLRTLPRTGDGRVFRGPRGGRLKPDTVRLILLRDVLTPLAEQFPARDGGPGILAGRVHSFRHFFVSTAADANTSEQMLMDWLGHRESGMIRLYYHARGDEAHRQMDKLPSLVQPATIDDTNSK